MKKDPYKHSSVSIVFRYAEFQWKNEQTDKYRYRKQSARPLESRILTSNFLDTKGKISNKNTFHCVLLNEQMKSCEAERRLYCVNKFLSVKCMCVINRSDDAHQ